VTVLICGESGTGKELIARAIHYHSPRANNPLIVVNCAAIPEELLESELFGYVKGAFTGAYTSKQGRFELAHTGTIFLDEIGDMSLRLQSKILRLLEEREIEPLGATRTIKIDVRIIAATNKNLEEAVRKNQFREDLYYRLHVVPIYVPPLRERLEDLPLLINHFVNIYNKKLGRNVQGFSPAAIEVLSKYHWPGNVRELENLVEQMIVIYSQGIIDIEHLPDKFKQIRMTASFHLDSLWGGEKIDLNQTLSSLECDLLRQAIARAGGNKSRAAELLGLKRTTLIEKLRKYNLEKDEKNNE
ncbi:MAG: sigma-54 dependent transcriptional regulator, partial [Candidatus Sumerlaeia bacterium]|nr:sigma-54 dependent transcriptional regulator [Candidatus Sumerlaeia bacterium]